MIEVLARTARILSLAGFFMLASPAQAQAPRNTAIVCLPINLPTPSGEALQLAVTCGSQGIRLGAVDSYELIQFPQLDAALVVAALDDAKRAFLIIRSSDNSLSLEEITTAISLEAGRGALSSIAGISLNFDSATIGLIKAVVNSGNANGKADVSIDIAAIVHRSRATKIGTAPGGGQ